MQDPHSAHAKSPSRNPAGGSSGPGFPDDATGKSIGQYLIDRLQDYGVYDLFGIPGDYVLTFYSQLEQSPIRTIGCTREDCAGFAADAYARLNGMGAVCVTYGVGGLSTCNSIAGAYAEKSPVVLISGSPGMNERAGNPLLHHKIRDFRTQYEVFEKLCVAGSELHDPVTAFNEIDRVLDAAARFKRPVYLELPRDMVDVIPHISHGFRPIPPQSDATALAEAAGEAATLLASAEKPVVLAGVEIQRFGLQDQLLTLLEQSKIPVASTLLGKSVVRETHPLYVGLYEGALGDDAVTEFVEDSDCVLLLGAFMTDINLGIYTANLDADRCIYATSEELRIHHHHYHGVVLEDFLRELIQRISKLKCNSSSRRVLPAVRAALSGENTEPWRARPKTPISITRMYARLNEQLDDDTIVIADIGDALFGATELTVPGRGDFLSPAYYTSMGFSIPAALGAQIARPEQRVVAIVGDGAFQMTGMEMSSLLRYGCTPIIIVLDNHGYGTERILHPGQWEYNEIHPWRYSKLPEVLGGGVGYEVRTEEEFEQALVAAWADDKQLSLLQVHLPDDDSSVALRRLASRLGQRVRAE